MCDTNDEIVLETLDKLSAYEDLLTEFCTLIQEGHMLISKANLRSGNKGQETYFFISTVHHIPGVY